MPAPHPDGFRGAVPMLHVADSVAALAFYGDQLGFVERWRFQPGAGPNPAYVAVQRGPVLLHLSSFSGDGVAGGVVVLLVEDVDAVCRAWAAAGVDLGTGPVTQSWGNRECYVSDPFGNQLRLTQEGVG